MKQGTIIVFCTLVIVSLVIPTMYAQNTSNLAWGVEMESSITYKVLQRELYLGELKTEEDLVQVVVIDLPTIPDDVSNMSMMPLAVLNITYADGSSLDSTDSFDIYLKIYPLGTCEIARPEEEIQVIEEDNILYWLEDESSWGWKQDWANIVAISNLTLTYSKVDGALQSMTYSLVDRSSDSELEYIEVVRNDVTTSLIIAGVAVVVIVVVIIVFERKRRITS